MSQMDDGSARNGWMAFSVVNNLGLLFAFKYFNFFADSFTLFFDGLGMSYVIPHLDVLLPMGISFYTLQTLGYTIDVYKRKIEEERHLGIFALYVAYFPQLVAGPIERAKFLIPQLKNQVKFDQERAIWGMRMILTGLFKKVVIADQAGNLVTHVFENHESFEGVAIWLTGVLFSIQVYGDFAGYSDIAIGSAAILGVQLMTNFKQPLFRQSIIDLWANWHISLISWLKDYLFVPLIRKRWNWMVVIFIVYSASGLWHGASWNFLLWGSLNGGVIITVKLYQKYRLFPWLKDYSDKVPRLKAFTNWFLTLNVFSFFAILFRTSDFDQARQMYAHLIGGLFRFFTGSVDVNFRHDVLLDADPIIAGLIALFLLILTGMELLELQTKSTLASLLSEWPVGLRWGFYLTLVFLVILFSAEQAKPFVYFQF